jgi:hypothetical protein
MTHHDPKIAPKRRDAMGLLLFPEALQAIRRYRMPGHLVSELILRAYIVTLSF